jgi:hypothetical protein
LPFSTKLLYSIQCFPNWVLCQQLPTAARAAAAFTSLSSLVAVIIPSPENTNFSKVSVLDSRGCTSRNPRNYFTSL